MYERLIKRTIFVATCDKCGERDVRDSDPPRERFCPTCQRWIKYVEESFTGPEIGKP